MTHLCERCPDRASRASQICSLTWAVSSSPSSRPIVTHRCSQRAVISCISTRLGSEAKDRRMASYFRVLGTDTLTQRAKVLTSTVHFLLIKIAKNPAIASRILHVCVYACVRMFTCLGTHACIDVYVWLCIHVDMHAYGGQSTVSGAVPGTLPTIGLCLVLVLFLPFLLLFWVCLFETRPLTGLQFVI